ncbi:hypothetical protein QAD02_004804, partial [Eretmocerus hayati]
SVISSYSYQSRAPNELRSSNPEKVLESLKAKKETINSSALVSALTDIFEAYKNYPKNDPNKAIHYKRIFSILEQNIEKLSTQGSLKIFSILNILNMPESSTVYSLLVDHVLDHAEDLSLENYVYLFYKVQDTTLIKRPEIVVTRLQNASALNIELSLVIDKESDLEYLIRALSVVSRFLNHQKHHRLLKIVMDKLSSGHKLISIDGITSLLLSLGRVDHTSPKWQQIFIRIQYDLLKQINLLNEDQMKRIIGSLNALISQNSGSIEFRKDNFLLKELSDALIHKIVDGGMKFEIALPVLVLMTEIGLKSQELLNYTSTAAFRSNTEAMSATRIEVNTCLTLISILSITRYHCIAWDDLKDYIIESPEFMKLNYDHLIFLIEELMSLDWYPTHLLAKVFDGSFRHSLSFENNESLCRIYQKLKSDPAYNGPFPTDSQVTGIAYFTHHWRIFPDEFHTYLEEGIRNPISIRTSVRTKLYHHIDHVVALRDDGTPAPITDDASGNDQVLYLENLKVPDGCHMILILRYPLRRFFGNSSELLGVHQMTVESLYNMYKHPVLVVNEPHWKTLRDDQKTSYLMTEIHSRLKLASIATRSPNPGSGIKSKRPVTLDRDQVASAPEARLGSKTQGESRDHRIYKLNSFLNYLNQKYKGIPADVADKTAGYQKFFSRLEQLRHTLTATETIRMMHLLRNCDVPGCSTAILSLMNHVTGNMNELSIKHFLTLGHIIRDRKVDKELGERILQVAAKNMFDELSSVTSSHRSEELRIALQFAVTFLDQQKHYQIFEFITRRIYRYSGLITIDDATSMLISLRSCIYKPPRWTSLIQRVQNDLAKQTHLINERHLNRIMFIRRGTKNAGLNDYHNEELLKKVIIPATISNKLNLQTSIGIATTITEKLRYKSHELLEYCSNLFLHKILTGNSFIPNLSANFVVLIDLLNLSRHRSGHLKEIEDYADKLCQQGCLRHTALIRIVSDLLALNVYPERMLERILDDNELIPWEMPAISFQFRRIYQKLKSNPHYDGPIPTKLQTTRLQTLFEEYVRGRQIHSYLKNLQEGMGNPWSVRANIGTRLFHYFHYVVAFHEDGTPAALGIDKSIDDPSMNIAYLEALRFPSNCRLALIWLFEPTKFFVNTNELTGKHLMEVETLETYSKYPVVVINKKELEDLSDDERTSFLMEKINARLRSYYIKQNENNEVTSW